VIAVGSAMPTSGGGYQVSSFTPPDTEWVDVLAPGEALRSTFFTGDNPDPQGDPFEGWATWGGTSFAAALVSGKVAAVAADERLSPWEAYHRTMARYSPPSGRGPDREPPFWPLRTG
jgi:membrane-anchored mycosin MYCP